MSDEFDEIVDDFGDALIEDEAETSEAPELRAPEESLEKFKVAIRDALEENLRSAADVEPYREALLLLAARI